MASSCPMTFFVRLTRSNFSRDVCDICRCLPSGGMVQTMGRYGTGPRGCRDYIRKMELRHKNRNERVLQDELFPIEFRSFLQQEWNPSGWQR